MRLVHFAFLACAGCSFPRPQELTNDAGERPGAADSGVDAGAAVDGGNTPRCAKVGSRSLPWPEIGADPRGIASADLNGDGKVDLVIANYESTVSVLLGNGDGTFASRADYATGPTPSSIAIGDVNGDAKPDLVLSNNGAATVSVLRNLGP